MKIKRYLIILLSCLLSSFLVLQASYAQEKEKNSTSLSALSGVKFFKQKLQCIGCDLSNINLSYYDPGSLLQTPNSQKNCVMDISLMEANLSNVQMDKVKFIACGRPGTITPFRKIDLSKANLKNAVLSNAIFYAVSFQGADLSQVKLDHGKISLSNFAHANFSNANLEYAQSKRDAMQGWGANFYQTKFTQANLNDATLYGFFQGADFSGANLKNTVLNSTLDTVPFDQGHIEAAELWKNVNFTDANLEGAYILADEEATQDLEKAKKADLSQAIFCRTKMPDGQVNNKNCT